MLVEIKINGKLCREQDRRNINITKLHTRIEDLNLLVIAEQRFMKSTVNVMGCQLIEKTKMITQRVFVAEIVFGIICS